jgi:hypothetical protein
MVPNGRRLADFLSRHVPGWFAMVSFALSPFLIAICVGPLPLPAYFLVPLYVLTLLSLVFFAVSFHFHPLVSVLILILGYVEVYWLIPQWEAKWKKEHESQDGAD